MKSAALTALVNQRKETKAKDDAHDDAHEVSVDDLRTLLKTGAHTIGGKKFKVDKKRFAKLAGILQTEEEDENEEGATDDSADSEAES